MLDWCTQAELQPAWAWEGKTTVMAENISNASAVELPQRQQKTRVIAKGRPEDRKSVEN
jgi:Mg-chelatase subunit ChlI